MPVEFEPFDISEHLDNEEMIAGYLNAAAEDEDPNVLLVALAYAAKARGMMQVAKDAGLSRVSLYRSAGLSETAIVSASLSTPGKKPAGEPGERRTGGHAGGRAARRA